MHLRKQLPRGLIGLALPTATFVSTAVALAIQGLTSAANAAQVLAKSADAFVDSIGVNTHLGYTDTQYYSNYNTVKQKLVALGVRHIRDGGSSDDMIFKMKDLAAQGIKTNYVESPVSGVRPNSSYWVNPPAANKPGYNIVDFVKQVGTNVIESVEILNEIDLTYNNYYWHAGDTAKVNNDPNSPLYWVNYVRSVTQDTWSALKNNPATSNVNVIGPSLGMTYDYNNKSPLGDLSGSVDQGNFHPYPGGGNPFSYPFSYDTLSKYYWYGNFPSVNIDEYRYAFDVYAPPFGSKPMVATETGYNTSKSGNAISERIHGKYMPRLFLEYFRKGIARTFSYEFVDEWNDLGNPEANFGLLRNDLTPKPAYTALKNLIGVLQDPGSSFTLGSLDYTLNVTPPPGYNLTQYVHNLLLQKRDGTFYLVLWHEISDADISSTPVREVQPPAMPTTVTLNTRISSAQVYSLDDSGNMSSAAATINNNTISLNVTDKAMIVKLIPSK
jgi:hypothetical protein